MRHRALNLKRARPASLRRGGRLAGVLVAVAVVLTSCAGAEDSGTIAHRVSVWAQGTSFGNALGALHGDSVAVAKAQRAGGNRGNLTTACNALALDAESANNNLPTPDLALTDLLAKAYNLDYQAGTACYANTSAATMGRVNTQREEADRLLAQARAKVEALTGKTVSTTTTAPPPSSGGF